MRLVEKDAVPSVLPERSHEAAVVGVAGGGVVDGSGAHQRVGDVHEAVAVDLKHLGAAEFVNLEC